MTLVLFVGLMLYFALFVQIGLLSVGLLANVVIIHRFPPPQTGDLDPLIILYFNGTQKLIILYFNGYILSTQKKIQEALFNVGLHVNLTHAYCILVVMG